MDRLSLIKTNLEKFHIGLADVEWLVAEIERLRIIQQGYEAYKKSY